MHDQAYGFGRVWNLEGQPDPERFAGAQFICEQARWLSTLRDGCSAGWVALSQLILKFDTNDSGTLMNSLCVAGDFHSGDPRVAARNGWAGELRGALREGYAVCDDISIIEASSPPPRERVARHCKAGHEKSQGISGNEYDQKA